MFNIFKKLYNWWYFKDNWVYPIDSQIDNKRCLFCKKILNEQLFFCNEECKNNLKEDINYLSY